MHPLHVVVSLGTGLIPVQPVKACDVFRPEGLFDIARVAFGATALGQLLIDQVTFFVAMSAERSKLPYRIYYSVLILVLLPHYMCDKNTSGTPSN